MEAPVNHLPPAARALREALVRSISNIAEAVERMMEVGFYQDLSSREVWTALEFACFKGHARIVSVMLRKGANPGHKNLTTGRTVLMTAADRGHVEVVKILLQRQGQDVDEADPLGRTALWLAACHGHAEVVRVLLVEGGADANAAAAGGKTAEQVAESRGHQECLQVIQGFRQEMERVYVLTRARRMAEDFENSTMAHVCLPGAAPPSLPPPAPPLHLRGRVEEGRSLPVVEVRMLRRSKRKGGEAAMVDEERRAVLHHMVNVINGDLFEEVRQLMGPR